MPFGRTYNGLTTHHSIYLECKDTEEESTKVSQDDILFLEEPNEGIRNEKCSWPLSNAASQNDQITMCYGMLP